jgi:ABC-type spermidine/putrescine transport system permease subunit II
MRTTSAGSHLVGSAFLVGGVVLLWLPAGLLVVSSFHYDVRPHIGLDALSLRAFREALTSLDVAIAVLRSLAISLPAAAASTILGWYLGHQLRRGRFVDRLAVLTAFIPLLLPPHAVAWAFAWTFRAIGLPRGPVAVVVAHILLFLPIAVLLHWLRAFQLAEIPEVARNLGTSWMRTLRGIILPHQWPIILAVFVIVAALSLNESTVAYYVSDIEKPFSVTVAQMLSGAFDPVRYAASVALFLATSTLLLLGLGIQWQVTTPAPRTQKPAKHIEGKGE